MINKNLHEQEMEATLNSLDGLQRAEAAPFFYTRLKARMEKEYSDKGIMGIAWLRPQLAFAALALLAALNVFTIINKKQDKETYTTATSTSVTEQVASDYGLGIANY